MRKSDRTLRNRNNFVREYGIQTLRALSVLRKMDKGVAVRSKFSSRSLAAYRANLNRGAYSSYVGPNFRNDKLNLDTCNR